MSVDKQRVQAVELLNSLGYRWTGLVWEGSAPAHALHVEADAWRRHRFPANSSSLVRHLKHTNSIDGPMGKSPAARANAAGP